MAAKKIPKTEELRLNSLPRITPALVENLLNEHIAGLDCYHGRFRCGKRLGDGGSGIVYRLHYTVDNDQTSEKDEELMDLSLVVKSVNPISAYLASLNKNKNPDNIHMTDTVKTLLEAPSFMPSLRGSRRVLEVVAQCHQNRFYEHHFLHYYPDLSFSIDSVIPCASLVVMDEVAGTLKNVSLPEDLPSIIRMIVKLGKEIGAALQVSEYSDDGTGFIHRDIKPPNIGITLNFKCPDVYEFVLIDIESGIPESSITDSTRTIIVNEFAIAPEMTGDFDKDEIDYARVDMFNLGCLMKYVSNGQFDFLPEGLKRIIRKASNKEPSHRYDNGEELIEDLQQFEESYGSEEGTGSVNISRFMEEQKEQLAEEKRQHMIIRNELNEKLKKQRKDIKEYKLEIQKWKEDYDRQIEQEEMLNKAFEDYKTESGNQIRELTDEIERLKKALHRTKGEDMPESTLVRKVIMMENGVSSGTVKYQYDANGRMIKEQYPDADDRLEYIYTYSDEGSAKDTFRRGILTETEKRDSSGALLSLVRYQNGLPSQFSDYRYTYNRRHRIAGVYINDVLREKHKYDWKGSQISEHRIETILGNDDFSYRIEIFNENGSLDSLITYNDFHDQEDTGYTKTSYTYNENGLEIQAVCEDENHHVLWERTRYYDSFNRLITETTTDQKTKHLMTREFIY